MKDVLRLLEQKERIVGGLLKAVDDLQLASKAIRRIAKQLSSTENTSSGKHRGEIVSVLEENGHPMHTREIARGMTQRYGKDVSLRNLSHLLFGYARKRVIFYKADTAKNTYGLLKWQSKQVA